MRLANHYGCLYLLCLSLVSLACSAPAGDTETIHLVEMFDESLVEPAPTNFDTPARSEWSFDDEDVDWTALSDFDDARVRDGRLTGRSASKRPVIELIAATPLGSGDRLHSVVVRARVSSGSTLSVTTLGAERPAGEAALRQGPPGPLALHTPLLTGEDVQTYTIQTARNFPLGHPIDRTEITRVLVSPTDEPGAQVEIESVRLVFRKEHLASLPSGIGWHGLSEIYHETLVTRSPETVRFCVDMPSRPWLDLAVGTIEEGPVGFRVEVAEPGAASGDLVLSRSVTTPERWEPVRVDLDAWAGHRVDLLLRTEAENKAAVGLWGTAVVRSGRGPEAARDLPKGVIVFIGDTLRRDYLQPYGYERANAPTLTRLASEGAIFLENTTQGVWTKASVPSIMSSAYPATTGVRDFTDRLPASTVTLAEALREAGYATFATSSVPFSGQLSNLQQGVEQLHESASIRGDLDGAKSARPYTDRMLDWIETHRDVPFFAFLHAMDPHSPYEPRPPFNTTWFPVAERESFVADMETVKEHIAHPLMRRFGMPSRDELVAAKVDPETYVAREVDWYDGSILGMDAEIERIVSRLEELDLADDVILVFLSDHGEEFLDHGRHWHGNNAYGENTGVPLIVWAPGRVPAGIVVSEVVQSLDVMPTILDLAGLEIPDTAQGQSLVPLMRAADGSGSAAELGWEARPAISERFLQGSIPRGALGEDYNYYALTTSEWKLVRVMDLDGELVRHELYDHRTDPLDQSDVSTDNPEITTNLVAQLDRWVAWAGENRLASDEEAMEGMSAEELERLRSLGYVQ